MRSVIVVAPRDARWAHRAATMLASSGHHVARLDDTCGIGALLVCGRVGAVLFDRRVAKASLLTQLHTVAPATRLLFIAEDGDREGASDDVPWPRETDAAIRLLVEPS
jgi:hypothetical protein